MKRKAIITVFLVLAIVFLLLANLAWGSVSIPLSTVFYVLTHAADVLHSDSSNYASFESLDTYTYIIMESRLPSALTAMLSGAALFAILWLDPTCLASAAGQGWRLPL